MRSLWLERADPIPTDPLQPGSDFDDVVVGAGLTGLVTAVLLARSGRSVAVLEARQIGAVTTGHTTGKVSLLQGTMVSRIVRSHTEQVAGAYLDGNREGLEWLVRYAQEHRFEVQRRDAYTYASAEAGAKAVRTEFDACRRLGLEVSRVSATELPFPTYGAVRLRDQAQLDPMDVLAALAAELRGRGGRIVERARVSDLDLSARASLNTTAGAVSAENVILATGIPFLDRGLYFAKVTPQRSYAIAFDVDGPIPRGMYISADAPTRSLRTASHGGSELLLVGGNSHPVGRQSQPPSELVADLRAWTERWFPGAQVRSVWSAQDYESHNDVPFVGRLPRGGGHVWVATGYSKWGMANAVAAGLRITAEILGGHQPWATILSTRVSKPVAAVKAVGANVAVGTAAVRGWVGAELHPLSGSERHPAEGDGLVGNLRGTPVAISTVGGTTCAVSAVCTHLGGVLRFNDLEKSWDCPLHGSRFAADGSVLEGPATQPLRHHEVT